MTFNIIGFILPEITIAIGICSVILVNSLVKKITPGFIHGLILLFLSLGLFFSFVSLEIPDNTIFNGHYAIDSFGTNLKIIALIAAILVHLSSVKSKQNIKEISIELSKDLIGRFSENKLETSKVEKMVSNQIKGRQL